PRRRPSRWRVRTRAAATSRAPATRQLPPPAAPRVHTRTSAPPTAHALSEPRQSLLWCSPTTRQSPSDGRRRGRGESRGRERRRRDARWVIVSRGSRVRDSRVRETHKKSPAVKPAGPSEYRVERRGGV